MLNSKIISIDAETNGLWGKQFAVAFVVYENGLKVDEAVFKCPIEGHINEWVKENVLPQIESIPDTHSSYDAMLIDMGKWWIKNKVFATALWHMGHVVESFLFRELVMSASIGEWDAPYCPIEVSQVLAFAGEEPDSVDKYVKKYELTIPEINGGTHNPLYDAIVAAEVYFHIQKNAS